MVIGLLSVKVQLLTISLLVRLVNTAVEETGKFISRQAEVNEPVVETVGNISSVLVTSPFGSTVQRTVEVMSSHLCSHTSLLVMILRTAQRL